MTFHVGNGIKLSKEEENLPFDERERVIADKRKALEEVQWSDPTGRAAALDPVAGRNVTVRYWTDEEEAEARRRYPKDYEGPHPDEANERSRVPKDLRTPQQSTPQRDISFGVIAAEDPKWKAELAERRKNRAIMQNAMAAARSAQQAKRDELRATGMYFDDGRGSIRLREKFALNQQARRDPNGTLHVGTPYNDMASKNAFDINQAGKNAFEAVLYRQEAEKAARGRDKTREIVEQNEFELAQQEERKKQRGINLSKGHLAIFDGLVAAYKALDSKYNVSATHRDERRVGQLKDKNGRIIGYGAIDKKQVYADNDGIRVQNGEDGKPTVRNGFVGIGTIDTINRRLRETGNNKFKITGIIARQKIDAIGNKAEPMFYVQGIRADGTQFGKTMSMKDVYNFGKENYIGSGENDENAEALTVDTVTADARPSLFYKHCYCPSNPKSYEILFDIYSKE
jgi:hypothetical protein